jgi:Putative transposase DNA-binding domain
VRNTRGLVVPIVPEVGREFMSIAVFKFGLLPPTVGADTVRSLIRIAHDHRKRLVEIERERRAKQRALEARFGDVAASMVEAKRAEVAREEASRAISVHRARTRSRSETPEMKAALAAAKAEAVIARNSLREIRKRMREDDSAHAESDAINEAAGEAKRAARAAFSAAQSGGWGTYTLVEDAANRSTESLSLYDGTDPNDPRLPRWSGEGRVGHPQIIGGISVATLMSGTHPVLAIKRVPLRVTPGHSGQCPDPRSKRSHRRGYALRMRIGSDAQHRAIYAEWPMIVHRRIPQNAVIASAVVSLVKCGPRERWTTEMSIRCDDFGRDPCGPGTVAIDVGWRQVEGGIRVCRWRGDDADSGELILSDSVGSRRRTGRKEVEDHGVVAKHGRAHGSVLSQLDDAAALRGLRDTKFDVIRASLKKWLDSQVDPPGWLMESCATLAHWRSPAKMVSLVRSWREHPFDFGAEMLITLEAWCRHDRHLWQWENSQRETALRRRRDEYRIFGAWLTRKYGTVVFEDFDLRRIAVRAPRGEGKAENETARAARHAIATSELRNVVANAFISRGGSVETVDPYHSTHQCHVCGSVEAFDAAAYITHQCKNGHVWDQDDNAAAVLLARWIERRNGVPDPGVARDEENPGKTEAIQETSRQKSRRMADERRARLGVARKANDKVAE